MDSAPKRTGLSPDGPTPPRYETVAGALGMFAGTVDLGSGDVGAGGRDTGGRDTGSGALLADPEWLAARVADTGRRWDCDDARVNGTLWWYSASSTLVVAPLALVLSGFAPPDPAPASLRMCLRENGYLAAVRSTRTLGSVEEFHAALLAAHDQVITALSEVSGATPRALWAIASDSIAGRALDVGRALAAASGTHPSEHLDEARHLAATLTTPPLIPARFVDVDAPSGGRTYVRRSSCCLIYAATGNDTCVSCPRQTPEVRLSRLTAHTADS